MRERNEFARYAEPHRLGARLHDQRPVGEIVATLFLITGNTPSNAEALLSLLPQTCPPCLAPHFAKIEEGVMQWRNEEKKEMVLKRIAMSAAAADPALR